MGHERAVSMNASAERLAEATLASWDTVTDAAARQQEQLARFALGWTEESIEMLKGQAEANLGLAETLTEQYEKQAEALEILIRESTEAWANLLFASVSGSGKVNGASARPEGAEEISRRLEKLSSREITKLKAYEERHKKHSSLLERFDRALV